MFDYADKHTQPGGVAYAAPNVSIIRYDMFVAKEDREAMSPKVCFGFCSTVKNMGYFGIIHGRDCYCTPYFDVTAGGESDECDLPCEGDAAAMCGGMEKSSIWGMHSCPEAAPAAATGGKLDYYYLRLD